MTPDKKTLKTILRQARTLHKEESKADDLLRAYFKQVSPDQHPPFIERNMVHGYIQAIEDIYGAEMHDHVSYWLYDVPAIAKTKGKVECTDQNGKKYDANNLGSYVNFILAIMTVEQLVERVITLADEKTAGYEMKIENAISQYHQDLMNEVEEKIGAIRGVYSAQGAIEKVLTIIKSSK